MRNYLTTGDIARRSKKTRQHIWNLWIDGKLKEAELLDLGGVHLRFKKTPQIEAWCQDSARQAAQRVTRRRKGQYRFWTQCHEALLGRLVRKRRPNQHSDLVAFRAWKELSVRNDLTVDDLNESYKRGVVTRIKRHRGAVSAGWATW